MKIEIQVKAEVPRQNLTTEFSGRLNQVIVRAVADFGVWTEAPIEIELIVPGMYGDISRKADQAQPAPGD